MTTLNSNIMAVVTEFQRFAKGSKSCEVTKYSLARLQQVDAALGNRDLDAGYRIAIRQRIADIQAYDERKRQSLVRAGGYLVTLAISVLVVLVTSWFTK